MKASPAIALCLALSAFCAFGGGSVCYGYNHGELIAEGGDAASGTNEGGSSRTFRLKRGSPEPVLQPSVPSLDSQAEVEAGTASPASAGGAASASTSTLPASTPGISSGFASASTLPDSAPGTSSASTSTSTLPGSAPAPSTPLQGGVIENRKFQGVSAVDGLAGRAGITGPIPTTLGAGVATTDSVPAVYQGWLSQAHPQFFLGLSKMSDRELVIVTDKYDQT